MRLDELIEGLEIVDLSNLFPDMEVASVVCDSREARPGAVFVAIQGEKADGHDYIDAALEAGVTAVVQSRPLVPGKLGSFLRVASPRAVYAELSARLAGYPSRQLRVIGVTGTNGKTSTVLLIAHLLRSAGHRPAVLGTLGLQRPGEAAPQPTGLTTPDAGRLQKELQSLVEAGASHLVMEVSSHSLAMDRVLGIEFAGGVFTNLSQDHLDYHGSLEAYADAKRMLFTRYLAASGGYSIINADDPVGFEIAGQVHGVKVTYGQTRERNLVLANIQSTTRGLVWEIVLKNGVWPARLTTGENHEYLRSPLVGLHNAYNCSAAAAVALMEGLSLAELTSAMPLFPGVPGRLQRIENPAGINVYVDYAHTPDALVNVLHALDGIRPGGARIITVFGCGGDRDPLKRPQMGSAAQQGSDSLVVTSDNPRSEDPEAIIAQILTGVEREGREVRVEPDRRRAIALALAQARAGDIVLIAGKGHEDYQIFKDKTVHFSDVEEVEAVFAG